MSYDLDRLFDQLGAMTVGYGPVFRDFHITKPSYPPHNIVKISDNEFMLELALAGFKRSEINVQVHQGVLTISGERQQTSTEGHEYQYRGIANRQFTKSFRIAEYFEVSNAKFEDGILTMHFVKNVPDIEKPKLIAIK